MILESLYLRFKQFAGKVDAAFDRSKRFFEHACNFVVLKPIEIQEEGITKNFRQVMDGEPDILDTEVSFRRIRDDSLVIVQ